MAAAAAAAAAAARPHFHALWRIKAARTASLIFSPERLRERDSMFIYRLLVAEQSNVAWNYCI